MNDSMQQRQDRTVGDSAQVWTSSLVDEAVRRKAEEIRSGVDWTDTTQAFRAHEELVRLAKDAPKPTDCPQWCTDHVTRLGEPDRTDDVSLHRRAIREVAGLETELEEGEGDQAGEVVWIDERGYVHTLAEARAFAISLLRACGAAGPWPVSHRIALRAYEIASAEMPIDVDVLTPLSQALGVDVLQLVSSGTRG